MSTGNLVVQASDLRISNKGVNPSFDRTYNSETTYDVLGSDGSGISLYGNGWTNNFDAHLANNGTGGLSVFPGDGTRFDYTGTDGAWVAPSGVYAKLQWDGGNGYFWIKKDGVELYFYSPNQQTQYAAFAGRLNSVVGRNHNNSIAFSYSFIGDASSSENLSQITATDEANRVVTLAFGKVGTYDLLSTLSWPDGTQVSYQYDASGNLTRVTEPNNNSASGLPQVYQYETGNHNLKYVQSAAYTLAASGGKTFFNYDSSHVKIGSVQHDGNVNPYDQISNDGPIQPWAPGGEQIYRTDTFTYSSGSTTYSDSDLHSTTFGLDSNGRLVSEALTTGDTAIGSPATLTLTQGWFPGTDVRANNIKWITDARANRTDFAYDATGNLIAKAQPSVTTSAGTFRPTTWISYDNHNNVIGICDSIYVQAHGGWTGTPNAGADLCPAGTAGSTQYTWVAPGAPSSYEPYRELTSITKPSGYATTLAYDPAKDGGIDYGLPTSLTGAQFSMGGSAFTPSGAFVYDRAGNVLCKTTGAGHWWTMTYDTLGRVTAKADPDDSSVNGSVCGKSPGQYQTAVYYSYYPNGQLKSNATSAQQADSKPSVFQYDPDGNLNWSSVEVGFPLAWQSAITRRYYDAADRLVEIQLPSDTGDFYGVPWSTKYIYDLTQGGSPSIGDSTYGSATMKAYGKLYKTQRYVPSAIQWGAISQGANPPYGWVDAAGTGFDALNRPVRSFYYQPGGTLQSKSYSFDATTSTLGLLTSVGNAEGDQTTLAYDAIGRVSATQDVLGSSSDSATTPAKSVIYDPDGRIQSIVTSAFGTQTFGYDVDGNSTSSSEPTGGSGVPEFAGSGSPSSAATYAYAYYPNGWMSTVSVVSAALTQNNLLSYTYRDDKKLSSVTAAYGGNSYLFTSGYTAAGRLTTRTDPFNSNPQTNPSLNVLYDTYGRVSSFGLPEAFYESGYREDGLLTGFTTYNATGSKLGATTYTYNTRGEIAQTSVSVQATGKTTVSPKFAYANGFGYPPDTMSCDQFQNCTQTVSGFDARNAASLGTMSFPVGGPTPAPPHTTYDVAGRLIDSKHPTGGYDTHDRTVKGGDILAWGPSGHAIDYFANGQVHTMHWLGGQPLFETNSSNQLEDLKIGSTADITPLDSAYSGLTVWHRDMGGTAVSQRTSTGTSELDTQAGAGCGLGDAIIPQTPGFTGAIAYGALQDCRPSNNTLGVPRPGILSDQYDLLEGVRLFSPKSNQFTTPDQSPGSVTDPMSQLPYQNDRNNYVGYSDPTGLESTPSNPNTVDPGGAVFSDDCMAGGCTQTQSTSNGTVTVTMVPVDDGSSSGPPQDITGGGYGSDGGPPIGGPVGRLFGDGQRLLNGAKNLLGSPGGIVVTAIFAAAAIAFLAPEIGIVTVAIGIAEGVEATGIFASVALSSSLLGVEGTTGVIVGTTLGEVVGGVQVSVSINETIGLATAGAGYGIAAWDAGGP